MGIHVVVSGNPVDGLRFYGPFATADEASEWAQRNSNDLSDWWIAPLDAAE